MTAERGIRRRPAGRLEDRLQAAPGVTDDLPVEIAGRVYLQELGLRLRALRVRRQINQEQLAEMASVFKVTLGSIERGEHAGGLLTHRKLAQALGMDVGDLVCEGEAS